MSVAAKTLAKLRRSASPPINWTPRRSGTGTLPSPNAKTLTFSGSGNRESCSSSHGTFLFISVNEAQPVAITKASRGNASSSRHCLLSCGLKIAVSTPGGITRTPPQALAMGLCSAMPANQRLFATIWAPQSRYAFSLREYSSLARNSLAGHRRIGHEPQLLR